MCTLQAEDEGLHQGAIEETMLGICVVKHRDATDRPEDIGIVLKGQLVLHDLDNVALAVAMLFGLMYALNLTYPSELKYSFEVLQKVVMELDGNTLSKKAQVLKKQTPTVSCCHLMARWIQQSPYLLLEYGPLLLFHWTGLLTLTHFTCAALMYVLVYIKCCVLFSADFFSQGHVLQNVPFSSMCQHLSDVC